MLCRFYEAAFTPVLKDPPGEYGSYLLFFPSLKIKLKVFYRTK